MAGSAKASDLRRDPRYVLHSAVTGPDSGEGELKLYGSAVEEGQDLRAAAAGAWWLGGAPDKAVVFTLRIGQAAFIGWDIERGVMTVHRWSPASGYAVARRSPPYPIDGRTRTRSGGPGARPRRGQPGNRANADGRGI
jgi:hypothetical protein